MLTIATAQNENIPFEQASDFDVCHAFLYHGGEHSHRLGETHHLLAMQACDGYGSLTARELTEQGLSWDWSHVRDSSPEALFAAAEHIRSALRDADYYMATSHRDLRVIVG